MDINANDPALKSWLPVPADSDFPIQNLPFGIFKTAERGPRPGVAIGEYIVDIRELVSTGLLDVTGIDLGVFQQDTLNAFAALGRPAQRAVRERVSQLLQHDNQELHAQRVWISRCIVEMRHATMCMPVEVGDYTDFYSSIEHATNVGIMFRGVENALMPNWKHIPIGYHGRASSIVISGTDIHRPKGQTVPVDGEPPVFGPSKQMDFELEVAFIVGKGNALGHPIPVGQAEEHLFGLVLFNDWSARDIQKWEYVPLGPFLGKNFGSSISAWVVLMDALEPYRVDCPVQDPAPQAYLGSQGPANFDIQLEVFLQPADSEPATISRSNFKYMYWNMRQQLAHHTINGCNMRPGDMCASGTISGHTPDSYGSMLELAWKGTKPLHMPDGSERKFIQDGDRLTIKGFCNNGQVRIGFGEVTGLVLPAL